VCKTNSGKHTLAIYINTQTSDEHFVFFLQDTEDGSKGWYWTHSHTKYTH